MVHSVPSKNSPGSQAEHWKRAPHLDGEVRVTDPDNIVNGDAPGMVSHIIDKKFLPLTYAVRVLSQSRAECVRLLLEAGADPDAGGGAVAPLLMVVGGPGERHDVWRESDLEVYTLLLEAGADPNAAEPFQGMSVTNYAAQKGLDYLLDVLVAHGADLERANKGGTTPMMVAAATWGMPKEARAKMGCGESCEPTIRLLVRLGAKLEPPSARGSSSGIRWVSRRTPRKICASSIKSSSRIWCSTSSATAAMPRRPTRARAPRRSRSASGSSTSSRPRRRASPSATPSFSRMSRPK